MVSEAPVSLPGKRSRVGVGVTNALLDRVLEQVHVLLEVVGGPGMEHDVEKLANVTPDLLGLAGRVAADDRDEARAERVLEDELEAHKATRCHDLGAVGNQLDQRRHQELKESVHLRKEKMLLKYSNSREKDIEKATQLRESYDRIK